ncbi:hypothetical protein DPMN_142244 [Dreissena polymorpha]|uniref:Uncharacterized protein n=1 Tax=Dreissena polymorpha TaxID=45954 RepID=A0A9D4GE41_DREPO|nr:hypothetical protein DPMN_142244 [Dreissena polymorpha]
MTCSIDKPMSLLPIPVPNMKPTESNLSKQTSTRHSRKLRFMNIRYYHLAANRIIVLRTV